MKTYLIVDASNILYRSFFASLNETYTKKSYTHNGYDENREADVSIPLPNANDEIDIGLAVHKALVYLNKYYKQFKANEIIMVFDPEISWRKAYTKNKDAAYTKKVYKANRRKDLTQSQIERFKVFDEHVDNFYKLLKEKTGVITLRKKYIECDDFIARLTQLYPNDKHIIISADKDFLQLLNSNVTLIDPATDKPRDLSEWGNDAKYFIFEKCIRGDIGDNVQSSYPRLRKNKIVEAYSNDVSRVNIMQHTFDVEWLDNGTLQKHTYETGKLFEENQFLMDLTQQPEPIVKIMDTEIEQALTQRSKFDYMGFLRYCGSLQLHSIVKDIANFVPLLSGKGNLIN